MKGLLLKDFYLLRKYCRAFIFMVIVFWAASLFAEDNAFLSTYPVLLASVMPVTLISYDEREKWNLYSAALPYSRGQIVSAKYLTGLLSVLVVMVMTVGGQTARMVYQGVASPKSVLAMMAPYIVISLIGPSVLLPIIYKFGTEKGRIAYYILIGVICGSAVFIPAITDFMNLLRFPLVIAAATIVIYAGSWLLSIAIYRKKELC